MQLDIEILSCGMKACDFDNISSYPRERNSPSFAIHFRVEVMSAIHFLSPSNIALFKAILVFAACLAIFGSFEE